MLILERAITRYYWMGMYKYLYRKIKNGRLYWVKGSVACILCSKNACAYAFMSAHEGTYRPIAWLYLTRQTGWEAWEVAQVFVFPQLRGKGMARTLYQAAINHDQIMIASGKTQTKYARALWESFVKRQVFDVFAIDFKDFERRSQVFWDRESDELWCELPMYTRVARDDGRDVRLIATRKKT